uniref:Plexin b1b n=1 Tax=Paramormyrops kingsleyae TaxID=1676925 RepID=A0A3B3R222_9TELE
MVLFSTLAASVLLSLLRGEGNVQAVEDYPSFSHGGAVFEHLALHPDPAVGRVYVGGKDRLFQLSKALVLEADAETGPVNDSRECLPPILESSCPQARSSNNHNKLLLVDPYSQELISCGSVYQGICQKRNLEYIREVLFSTERPVDTQYVAANDPNVTTVGLVVQLRSSQPVLFVGRGYTGSHPPISTRNLASAPVFSYEETAKLAVAGRLPEYDHHFVTAFSRHSHVYFLFYRRDLKSSSREYKTYVSRVCLDDAAYYSYVELPLVCNSSVGKRYNLLQAARVGLPGTRGGGAGDKEVLLGVFATRAASSNLPSEDSALCVFDLEKLDRKINSTRDLCYTRDGGEGAAYIEYEVKSNCATLPAVSRHPLRPALSRHSCSFYRQPVAECYRHLDCNSCLSAHDPYCGWCVLEGRCGRRSQCPRADRPGQWLWSFDMEQHCLAIQGLTPSNISREEKRKIFLKVPGLPDLEGQESYSCYFQENESPASVTGSGVTCFSPDTSTVAVLLADFVTVTLSLRYLNVTVATTEFVFYDCGTVNLPCPSLNLRCRGCVTSRWGCNWCVHQHLCTHKTVCEKGVIIYNEQVTSLLQPTAVTEPPPVLYDHLEERSTLKGDPVVENVHFVVTPTGQEEGTETGLPQVLPDDQSPTSRVSNPSPVALPVYPISEAATALPTSDPTPPTDALPVAEPPTESPPPSEASSTTPDSSPFPLGPPARPGDVLPPSLTEVPPPPATTSPPPTSTPAVTVPPAPTVTPAEQGGRLHEEEPAARMATENDTAPSAAAVLLSGDWEFWDHGSTDFLPQEDEGAFWARGVSACPCVEAVLGSPLLPVNVERKITLQGRNLQLFKDTELKYECVLVIEGRTAVVDSHVEVNEMDSSLYDITCQSNQRLILGSADEPSSNIWAIDALSSPLPAVTLYNCSAGRSDCSRCHTAPRKYGCAWCGGTRPGCLYRDSCADRIEQTCPAPVIHFIEPTSGLVEGGTVVTISGSNLGQKAEDIQHSVTVAGFPCTVNSSRYEISSRIVCKTLPSGGEKTSQVSVKVNGGQYGLSFQKFSYQDPKVTQVYPQRGPKAGGTSLTITGRHLCTGRAAEVSVTVGGVPCIISSEIREDSIECVTGSTNNTGPHRVTVHYYGGDRHLQGEMYNYTPDPNIMQAAPSKSFQSGGRTIRVSGHNLDVVQEPQIRVTLLPLYRVTAHVLMHHLFVELCQVNSSSLILCSTPLVEGWTVGARIKVEFLLDNLRFDFDDVSPNAFSYEHNPILYQLNSNEHGMPYRYKPGSIISVEGENLDLAIFKEEVVAMIGEGVCSVKTLTRNHLYCEPPSQQPLPAPGKKREGMDSLPEFTVQMGNLNFSLGRVQYDSLSQSTFPLEAQIGVGVGASIVALIVFIIVLIYRRKSKQALRDYKKVQIQLENLETSVRDRCKKEFTDLMTEMMDMSSDLVGSGIPFLDYRMYAERIFFPGHRESPLRRDLDVQECRRQTVEQGLVQLSNLLNSKLFLTKFIHTLESQRTFSPRDRAYVASLLTVALHGKLEYFTDILKTLLNDLVEQYVAKNPKLMLRRTETVVEKLLTNWMSICLYAFLRDSAGEPLYMLFRAIKHQVDKGPVDTVTGKAKYTLNDNRLLREDIEYHTLTVNVLMQGGGSATESQPVAAKVLDCDTITQVKEKILDQVYKGTSFSHRPHADSLDLEWRSGVAGHLILSDEDLTSVCQGNWKRLNTLQHYKVPDGATVALVPRHSKQIHHDNHDYMAGEKTPMLEDADEGGVRPWHLVKASEEPDLPKHRRGSLRERERAKAIPEIYLTRLLSMKGTLQKFVDDLFQVILSTSRPVPLAVKYFFDLLDDRAVHHGISDSETIHIWKTNSLPLRFWINIIKNPQFIFDVQASDNVDAVLSVIAQTFMDSCTIAEHKLGRDSPINKLLYARDIPRYKQMVERYYADIRQTISASDQEMNSALAELSRNYSGELNYLVALHELYKYINKYYDQIITALEEDSTAQKMQLGYRLQQVAAAVENKVTDL